MDYERLVGKSPGFKIYLMTQDLFSLEGKLAVITGGSGTLGLSIAKAFVRAGAKVVLVARGTENLARAADSLGDLGECHKMSGDVSNSRQVEDIFDRVENELGQLDILVTAAGTQFRSPVIDFTEEKWNEVIATNLTGTFLCAKFAAKKMLKKSYGKIIIISSLTAEIGIPNISAYAASRGGISQFAKTMAIELAQKGITVNCIGPGRFHTPMTADILAGQDQYNRLIEVIPMGRLGEPDDLTGVSLLLASDASSYITGQTFYVDGGWLAGGGNIKG
jgi:gluconate 5-dehydrogenase